PLSSPAAKELQGTLGATRPFWSPDSRYVAFFSQGKLKKVSVGGGTPQIICDAAGNGSWNKDDVILFADQQGQQNLYRVSANGGNPVRLNLAQTQDGTRYSWPWFLPDGNHFLFVRTGSQSSQSGIFVGTLDTGDSRRLLPETSRVIYVSPGYLLYMRDHALMAQRLDVRSLSTVGDPVL